MSTTEKCCVVDDFDTPCSSDEPSERCGACPRLFCEDHWASIQDIYFCEGCQTEYCRPCGKDHPVNCPGTDDDDEGDHLDDVNPEKIISKISRALVEQKLIKDADN